MRQKFDAIFPADGLLPDIHNQLEMAGYEMNVCRYIAEAAGRQPGAGLPPEAGLCEVRAYTGNGLEPLLVLVYACEEERGVPTACVMRAKVDGVMPLSGARGSLRRSLDRTSLTSSDG